MDLRYVQCPTVSSIPRNGLTEKSFLHGRSIINLPSNNNKCTDFRRIKLLDFRARASGATKIKSQAQDASASEVVAKDGNLVFVAGATGKVGSRTVRELLKLGFKVRAGVRSVKRAESLVQRVQNMKLEGVGADIKPIDKLQLVECDLEKPDQIAPALGNASVIICCIGASEKEIFDVTGPYRIDYQATKNLIDAAISAKVSHFILLTSLGTNKVGFPAAILNLFWGVLIWKRKAEEALLSSGLPYTIVRPGGMERPTDTYKETHNITLSEEDTLFGGQVSNLQVAELMAYMAKNRSLSCCKVVEVIAETSAPLTPMGELLKKIPSARQDVCLPKESDDASGSQAVPERAYAEKELEEPIPPVATPLSPYIAYEDLKPPTSPTPTPSTSSGANKARKTEIDPTATSPISSSIEVNSSETSSIVIDSVTPQTEPKKQNPSSPYTNYEDLKPPCSPTPTPSSGATKASKTEIVPNAESSTSSPNEVIFLETSSIPISNVKLEISSVKQYFLSPYPNYEELKPPSSPTPSPIGSKTVPSLVQTSPEIASQLTGGNGDAKSGTVSELAKVSTESLASDQSPYFAYDDPKPTSSPSPSVPTMSGNNKPDAETGTIDHQTRSKAQPLSPYTMYEDLKPPSSPVPSPRKL